MRLQRIYLNKMQYLLEMKMNIIENTARKLDTCKNYVLILSYFPRSSKGINGNQTIHWLFGVNVCINVREELYLRLKEASF